MEIWKDVVGYEGLYQISNLGKVKSLPKEWFGFKNSKISHNGKILKQTKSSNGYLSVRLGKNKIYKTMSVHQLVAMAFLNHIPNGHTLVVDHINDDKLDNRLDNLQIVTHQFNTYKTQFNYSSKYKGVSWNKNQKKWRAQIQINKRKMCLGYFDDEYDAHLVYQSKLKEYAKMQELQGEV